MYSLYSSLILSDFSVWRIWSSGLISNDRNKKYAQWANKSINSEQRKKKTNKLDKNNIIFLDQIEKENLNSSWEDGASLDWKLFLNRGN